MVVDLPQAGQQDGVQGGCAGVRIIVWTIIDYAVHRRGPVREPGADEAPLRGVLVAGGVQVDARAERAADRAVHDGQLPRLAVVDLRAADQQRGAAGHRADADLLLVPQAGEIVLEGEEHLRGVRLLGVVVVVLLAEGLAAELGRSVHASEEGGEDRRQHRAVELQVLHQNCFSSRALTNALTSSSELKRMVMVPLPEGLRFSEMSLVKYLPTCSRMR